MLGNTWIVNAVIISGILIMILAANYLATRLPKLPQSIVASCLIGSCLAMYFVDVSQFAFLPYATKAVLVGLLTTLPMLFSGVLFIRSFAVVEHKDAALGANLIGALVGRSARAAAGGGGQRQANEQRQQQPAARPPGWPAGWPAGCLGVKFDRSIDLAHRQSALSRGILPRARMIRASL